MLVRLDAAEVILVSSAYILGEPRLRHFDGSFIKIMKSSGPRINPCGVPQFNFAFLYNYDLLSTTGAIPGCFDRHHI